MKEQTVRPWHERDGFWQTFEPVIFDAERRGLAPKEVEQLIDLLHLEPGQRICDLCCGIGRHSLELAGRGFDVTAVDRTERYLQAARRQAEAANLNIEFVHQDMRNFCREQSFDAVLNLFTSFGYFDARWDDRHVLDNIHRCLRPGGRLLVDVIGKEIVARIFRARDWHRLDDRIVLYERRVVDDWSRMENRWILIENGRQHEWSFSHRLYSATELRELFDHSGFGDVAVYGTLTGKPYDEKADRLVVVGRK